MHILCLHDMVVGFIMGCPRWKFTCHTCSKNLYKNSPIPISLTFESCKSSFSPGLQYVLIFQRISSSLSASISIAVGLELTSAKGDLASIGDVLGFSLLLILHPLLFFLHWLRRKALKLLILAAMQSAGVFAMVSFPLWVGFKGDIHVWLFSTVWPSLWFSLFWCSLLENDETFLLSLTVPFGILLDRHLLVFPWPPLVSLLIVVLVRSWEDGLLVLLVAFLEVVMVAAL